MIAPDILSKFEQIKDHWHPHVIAALNGQEVKIAKVRDSFDWHKHPEEDELFIVWKGTLFIELEEDTVSIPTGHMHIVPAGQMHRPFTLDGEEVWIMMMEPAGTLNTGDRRTGKTVDSPPKL